MTTISDEVFDRDELRAMLAQVLDVEESEVSDDTDFANELKVDSLLALEFVVEMEKKYQVKFTESEMREVRTLRSAHDLLQRKQRNQ